MNGGTKAVTRCKNVTFFLMVEVLFKKPLIGQNFPSYSPSLCYYAFCYTASVCVTTAFLWHLSIYSLKKSSNFLISCLKKLGS